MELLFYMTQTGDAIIMGSEIIDLKNFSSMKEMILEVYSLEVISQI